VTELLALTAVLEGALPAVSAASPALALGFVLGLQHALDADHLVAVSAIVSEQSSLRRSSALGAFWGIGHTISLLAVALLVIGLQLRIGERLALGLEFGVALMLIGLGLNVARKGLRQFRLHRHEHSHGEQGPHVHVHVHLASPQRHEHGHWMAHARRPLLVGMVHGLAGSAALMLLVLTTIPTPGLGLLYCALFGVGSIGGMWIMSSLLGLPVAWSAQRFGGAQRGLQLAAGCASVAFGLYLAWEIGVVDGLLF
jgi:hypothetical protein